MEDHIVTPCSEETILIVSSSRTFLEYPVIFRPVRIYPGGDRNGTGHVQRGATLNLQEIVRADKLHRSAKLPVSRTFYGAVEGTVVSIAVRVGGDTAEVFIERLPAYKAGVGILSCARSNQTQHLNVRN